MTDIQINASRRYTVKIGAGLLTHTGELASGLIKGRNAVIVSDSNVFPLYGETVRQSLEAAGFSVGAFVFPAGEGSKNTDTLVALLNRLAELRPDRSDAIFALGGGVTGDMAGLAAALYLRGIACIQLPTTLLAMVDSSVGGKTAVNLSAGKNLVGVFSQPRLVLCDTDCLQTLPEAVYAEGWAEIIKAAMIKSRPLADFLLKSSPGENIERVIAACVEIKRDVVDADEFDTGVRQILNFGHTVGHAIELLGDYRYFHGEAVALGMRIMARACCALGTCEPECLSVLETLLNKYKLPTVCDMDAGALLEAAQRDKKRSAGGITLVLPVRVGECTLKKTGFDELGTLLRLGLSS